MIIQNTVALSVKGSDISITITQAFKTKGEIFLIFILCEFTFHYLRSQQFLFSNFEFECSQ